LVNLSLIRNRPSDLEVAVAKFEPIDKISYDFVEAIRAEWNGDLAFTPSVLVALGGKQWDQVDILEVVEDGIAIDLTKEDAHETLIELAHTTTLGFALRVTVAYDPHLPELCVRGVHCI
jgi:hypothetical protein